MLEEQDAQYFKVSSSCEQDSEQTLTHYCDFMVSVTARLGCNIRKAGVIIAIQSSKWKSSVAICATLSQHQSNITEIDNKTTCSIATFRLQVSELMMLNSFIIYKTFSCR